MLLLAHPEAVLLVQNHQAQAGELHILLDQPVGADDDVDGAVGERLQRLGLLLRGAEARQLGEFHRPLREAVGKIIEVLFGQQRGRHQHRHLVAAHHRHEGGAQRDLGLAEADVAAHQTIHRLARLHVGHDRGDRGRLVRGLFVTEALGEGFVIVRRKREGVALARGAQRVQVEQFGGGVACRLHGAVARLFPLVGAEAVQRCLALAGTGVARNQVQVGDRHVELVAAGVLDLQELGVAIAQVHVGETQVLPDAVLCVHHRIARLQLGQVAQQVVDLRRARLAGTPRLRRDRVELGLGDDRERAVRRHEAFGERAVREQDACAALQRVGPGIDKRGVEPVLGEIFVQRLAPAGRRRDDQHRAGEAVDEGLELRHRVGLAPIDCDGWQSLCRAVAALREVETLVVLGQAEERVRGQEQFGRRQQGPVPVAGKQAVASLRVRPERLSRRIEGAVEHQSRGLWQIVEQGRGGVEEQRQVVLDAGRREPVAHVLVELGFRRIALEALAEILAEAGDPRLVEWKLARRQQAHVADRIDAALRVDIECADRLDLVVEQVDAVGHRAAHGEKVDQAAAHRELPRCVHLVHVRVATQRHLRAKARFVECGFLFEEEGVGGEKARWREPVQCSGKRDHRDIEFAARDLVQRRQPLRDQVRVWRKRVVGQRFPVGKRAYAQTGIEPAQFLGEPVRIPRARAYHHQRRDMARQLGKVERVGCAGKTGLAVAKGRGGGDEQHENSKLSRKRLADAPTEDRHPRRRGSPSAWWGDGRAL